MWRFTISVRDVLLQPALRCFLRRGDERDRVNLAKVMDSPTSWRALSSSHKGHNHLLLPSHVRRRLLHSFPRPRAAFYPNLNAATKEQRPFSRSAAKRECVMALGSIQHLQHYFTKTGLITKECVSGLYPLISHLIAVPGLTPRESVLSPHSGP